MKKQSFTFNFVIGCAMIFGLFATSVSAQDITLTKKFADLATGDCRATVPPPGANQFRSIFDYAPDGCVDCTNTTVKYCFYVENNVAITNAVIRDPWFGPAPGGAVIMQMDLLPANAGGPWIFETNVPFSVLATNLMPGQNVNIATLTGRTVPGDLEVSAANEEDVSAALEMPVCTVGDDGNCEDNTVECTNEVVEAGFLVLTCDIDGGTITGADIPACWLALTNAASTIVSNLDRCGEGTVDFRLTPELVIDCIRLPFANPTTCVYTVTIDDTMPPQLDCPTSMITLACEDSGITNWPATQPDVDAVVLPWPTVTGDNCVVVGFPMSNVVNTIQDNPCTHAVTFERVWNFWDCAGNTNSCTQIVMVVDTNPPTITTCPPATNQEGCVVADAFPQPDLLEGRDNCDSNPVVVVVDTNYPGGELCNPTNPLLVEFTYVLVDACSNTSAPCTQVVTIVDTTPPVAVAPPDITIHGCDTNVVVPTPELVLTADRCDTQPVAFVSNLIERGTLCSDDTLRVDVVYAATDDCGNVSAPVTQTVYIVDRVPPVITSCPPDYTTNACTELEVAPQTHLVMGTDTCNQVLTPVLVDIATNIGGELCNPNMPRQIHFTYALVDACSNFSASCEQVVTITDLEDPTWDFPADEPAWDCSNPTNPAIELPARLWSVDFTPTGGVGNTTHLMSGPDTTYGLGNIWNEYFVSHHEGASSPSMNLVDSNGSATPVTFTFTGVVSGWSNGDILNPLHSDYAFVQAPANLFDDLPAPWNFSGLTPGATYTLYLFGGSGRIADIQVDTNGDGVLTEAYVVAPANGGIQISAVASPTGMILGTFGNGGPEENWSGFHLAQMPQLVFPGILPPTNLMDNCDMDLDLEFADTVTNSTNCAVDGFIYQIFREWTLTDDCGNSITNTQVITVVDTNPPVVTLPPATNYMCYSDFTNEFPTVLDNAWTDDCSDVTWTSISATVLSNAPSCQTNDMTVTFTDECGNSSQVVIRVSINDTIPPTFDFNNQILPQDEVVDCTFDYRPEPFLTATDICDEVITAFVVSVTTMVDCLTDAPTNSLITNTWTATDMCGNSVSHTQVVVAIDTNPPVATVTQMIMDCTTVVTTNCEPWDTNAVGQQEIVISTEGFPRGSVAVNGPDGVGGATSWCDDTPRAIVPATLGAVNVIYTFRVEASCAFIFQGYYNTPDMDFSTVPPTSANTLPQTGVNNFISPMGVESSLVAPFSEDVAVRATSTNAVYFLLAPHPDLGCPGSNCTFRITLLSCDSQDPADCTVCTPCLSFNGMDADLVSGAVDDCDPNPTTICTSFSNFFNGCVDTYWINFTVSDDCGNTTNLTKTVMLVDTTAPECVLAPDVNKGCIAPEDVPEVADCACTETGSITNNTVGDVYDPTGDGSADVGRNAIFNGGSGAAMNYNTMQLMIPMAVANGNGGVIDLEDSGQFNGAGNIEVNYGGCKTLTLTQNAPGDTDGYSIISDSNLSQEAISGSNAIHEINYVFDATIAGPNPDEGITHFGFSVIDRLTDPAPVYNRTYIDLGSSGQRLMPAPAQSVVYGLPGAPAHNSNNVNYPTTPIGGGLTVALDTRDITGTAVGGLGWRDRGDSTSTDSLARLGEDMLFANAIPGPIRLTLGGVPAGTYVATSYHVDADFTQAPSIQVFVDNNSSGNFVLMGDTGNAGVNAGGVNGLTDTLVNDSAANFTFVSDGVNPVVIVFQGGNAPSDPNILSGLSFYQVPANSFGNADAEVFATATFSDGNSSSLRSGTFTGDGDNGEDTFFGFVAPPGETISSVSVSSTLGLTDEGFRIDDIAFMTSCATNGQDMSIIVSITDDCTAVEDLIINDLGYEEWQDGCFMARTRFIEIIDSCTNSTICSQTVRWITGTMITNDQGEVIMQNTDTEPPGLLNPPTPINLGCNEPALELLGDNGPYSLASDMEALFAAATDNCGVAYIQFVKQTTSAVNEVCDTYVARHFRIFDYCGNFLECKHEYIFKTDIQLPELRVDDLYLGCNPQYKPPPQEMEGVYAFDNCALREIVMDLDRHVTNQVGCTFTEERRWFAIDECGQLTGPRVQRIVWTVDTNAPYQISLPENVIGCATNLEHAWAQIPHWSNSITNVVATDDCSVVSVQWIKDIASATNTELVVNCEFTLTRLYRISDACGNFVDCHHTYTYRIDGELPVLVIDNLDLGCNPGYIPTENELEAFRPGITVMCPWSRWSRPPPPAPGATGCAKPSINPPTSVATPLPVPRPSPGALMSSRPPCSTRRTAASPGANRRWRPTAWPNSQPSITAASSGAT